MEKEVRARERFEDATLLALRMEEAAKEGKSPQEDQNGKGKYFPLEPLEATQLCQHLGFRTSDLQSRKVKICDALSH